MRTPDIPRVKDFGDRLCDQPEYLLGP